MLTLSQLKENFIAYESKLKHQTKKQKSKKDIAFKASVEREPDSDIESDNNENDDDVTSLARKLKRLSPLAVNNKVSKEVRTHI